MADILLGTQGWRHDGWIGSFYPAGTRPEAMLPIYAEAFSTVEVPETALAVPAEPVLLDWAAAVPEAFTFALTLPLTMTHEHRLAGGSSTLFEFCARARRLGARLGPIRIALSPAFAPRSETRSTLARFLAALPDGLRWAVEFRHRGWVDRPTLDLLRAHNVALVLADGRWLPRPRVLDLAAQPTADFAYVRWDGVGGLLDVSRAQRDRVAERRRWQRALRILSGQVSTIFGYVGHRFEGHAPDSVRALAALVPPVATPVESRWPQPQPV